MAAWEDYRAWLSDRRANLYLRKTWTSQISLECGSGFVFYRECAVTLRPFPPLQKAVSVYFCCLTLSAFSWVCGEIVL